MMQEVSTEVKSSKERYRAWLKEHNPRQYKKTLEMDQYTAYLASQPIDPEVLAFFEQPEHKAWHDAAWAEVGRVRSPSGALAILGLTAGASKSEIRNAYRRLARKVHPDRGGDEAEMKRINAAYLVLCPRAKGI